MKRYLSNLLSIKEIDFVTKTLLERNLQSQVISLMNYTKQITSFPHNLFQIIEEEGIFPNSFYEASIILILKPDKDCVQNTTDKYLS